jgi:hypothetical protein
MAERNRTRPSSQMRFKMRLNLFIRSLTYPGPPTGWIVE